MSNQKNNLKDKLAELEELLAWFEQDDMDIEEALKKYEKGSELAVSIREQLTNIENKITVLERRFDSES
ncbi:exodeoxyribonuclease VII small subunit [Candidatus Saccharibacteria bacterium]|nr:MAG: exodeoxyribonuclease VII small subunit [Candidatus Saccharibacteria bacterium]